MIVFNWICLFLMAGMHIWLATSSDLQILEKIYHGVLAIFWVIFEGFLILDIKLKPLLENAKNHKTED